MPAVSPPEPPSPKGVRTYDELATRLRMSLAWTGLSCHELHRRVVRIRRARGADLPAYNTVYRCLRPGRSRMDVELVVDIASVLLGDGVAAEWRQAHRAIAGRDGEAAVVSVADQLPDDIDGFVGRDAQLRHLLAGAGGLAVISGMAGIGKTGLAVHAAHRLARQGRFRDLRLVVSLRGFDPDRPAADPAAVLDGFLRRLGVPGSHIAGLDLAGRSAAFRRLMAGKDALVLLDNARSADQVLPLLPASPTCLVLVTSRRSLRGFGAARYLALDTFTRAESLALLRRTAGERVDTDIETAAEIAELVGHLPLALALVASRITACPDWTMADHLERLSEQRSALRLDGGIELALRASYDDLTAGQRRLVRLLTTHPGRLVDGYATAALAGTDVATARRLLAELASAGVIMPGAGGRYEMHDLVRVFAADRARDEEPARGRRLAMTRLLDYYRAAVGEAISRYAPQDAHRRPSVPEPATPVPSFTGPEPATAWLDAELANVVAVSVFAADRRWPVHVGHISSMLVRYLHSAGHFHAAEVLHGHAAAVGTGADRAQALNGLGMTYWRMGRYAEAVRNLEGARAEFAACGDRRHEGPVVGNLGVLAATLGDYRLALTLFQQAREIAREVGNDAGVGAQFGNAGIALTRLGHYPEAMASGEEALATFRAIGDRVGECRALDGLGVNFARTERDAEALEHYGRSLDLARETGSRADEGAVLTHLGALLARLGRVEEALDHHRRAVDLAREIGNREGELEAANDLGVSLRASGRLDEAMRCHEQALDTASRLGNRYEHARAHEGVAAVLFALGKGEDACPHRVSALTLFEELGTPEAARVVNGPG